MSIDYKISNEPPKGIYEEAQQRWGVDFDKGIVFTVGDTIHTARDLPPDVLAHELVHIRQQTEIGHELWWYQYFEDDTFRFQQELEAYRAQTEWVRKNVKDRNQQVRMIYFYADCLSGDMYGNMLTKTDALKLLC